MKKFWQLSPITLIVFLISIIFAAITFLFNWKIAVVEIVTIVVMAVVACVRIKRLYEDFYQSLSKLSEKINPSDKNAVEDFPLPVLVCKSTGKIIWCNELFSSQVMGECELVDNSVTQFIGDIDLSKNIKFNADYAGRMYTVYVCELSEDQSNFVLYFIEDTQLKQIATLYKQTRPCVMLITIDSLEEFVKNVRESDQAALIGGVERILENYITESSGFFKKLSRGRYIAVAEEQDLQKFIATKFKILEEVRNYSYMDITGATLSVGIGCGNTLQKCHELALQALDMSFGRGGDQVVVKSGNTYQFFGGVSKGVEKRTKVRTRIIASSIEELMHACDNVLIMGHRFADLDALGASVGIWSVANSLGKNAKIVMSRSKTLATPLLKSIEESGMKGVVIEPNQALDMVDKRTLLIICDTHIASFCECPELLEKCKTIVVIDHHRKTVNHIDNAVIFFHEPYASSASEMVAELVQYIGDTPSLKRFQAEALLSGIMLDTRNFIMRTGVRTFEAAAFLRSCGADTIAVKKLFSSTIEDYQHKTSIVSATQSYRGCAIAKTLLKDSEIRVIAAQAADELLGIKEIKASFVIFVTDDCVNISARSFGDINVQVIMEFLGGGGHQTMAATQLKEIDVEEAEQKLIEAIDASFN